jgi:hypothetical protein
MFEIIDQFFMLNFQKVNAGYSIVSMLSYQQVQCFFIIAIILLMIEFQYPIYLFFQFFDLKGYFHFFSVFLFLLPLYELFYSLLLIFHFFFILFEFMLLIMVIYFYFNEFIVCIVPKY